MIPLYRQTRLIHVPVKLKTPVTALLKTVPDSLSLGQVVATHCRPHQLQKLPTWLRAAPQ
jgi:hypothetical protein